MFGKGKHSVTVTCCYNVSIALRLGDGLEVGWNYNNTVLVCAHDTGVHFLMCMAKHSGSTTWRTEKKFCSM